MNGPPGGRFSPGRPRLPLACPPFLYQNQTQLKAEINLLRRANDRMAGDKDAEGRARDALLAEVRGWGPEGRKGKNANSAYLVISLHWQCQCKAAGAACRAVSQLRAAAGRSLRGGKRPVAAAPL